MTFGHWAKTIRPHVENFFGRVVKFAFYVSTESFWIWKTFSEKKHKSHQHRTLSKNVFGLLWHHLGKTVKTAVYVSIGTIQGKKVFQKKNRFFIFLGHWAQSIRPSVFFCFRQGCQNCLLRIHGKSLKRKSSIKRFIFFHTSLGPWAKRLSSFW